MAYLLMSAVFFLCLHCSVCEEEYTHYWPVTKLDRGRCTGGAIGDLCQDILNATKDLDSNTCVTPNVTGLKVKHMVGHPSQVIGGYTNLTLNCSDTTSASRYEWFTPCINGSGTQRCNTTGPLCTFQPRPSDDGQNVTCFPLDNTANRVYGGYHQLNLKYPPEKPPSINTKPPGKTSVNGDDQIECTVSGGKPLVTNVTLDCLKHQVHVGINKNGNTVSSSVQVDQPPKLTCTCSASWAPHPKLYTHVTRRDFSLPTSKQPASRASGLVVVAMTSVIMFVI